MNLNEQMALKSVLEFISVAELLQNAMNGFAEQKTTKAEDNADIICKALQVFL